MALESFHPVVGRWFAERVGVPSAPQLEGWPEIRSGAHTLIAAPTGTGKTLAAFLWAIDGLLRQGDTLPDETQVLYVSPLKALGNDVHKHLQTPLAELAEREPEFPACAWRCGRTPVCRPCEPAPVPRGTQARVPPARPAGPAGSCGRRYPAP